jgi:hypothetical protein
MCNIRKQIIHTIAHLLICLLKSPKASYKTSTTKETKHTHKQKTKHGNLNHLDYNTSVSATIPTIMWQEKIYIHTKYN